MKSFGEPDNLAVVTCSHVVRERCPILLVTHDRDDGEWQFLCGRAEHQDSEGMKVALEEIIALDPTVAEVADLPVGNSANRADPDSRWMRSVGGM